MAPKTKIKLEYPYSKDWKYGYLVKNPEGRTNLILYNSPTNRSTTQYSRYLMAIHLGRYLKITEHVDHIDGDVTNNTIKNLQILTFTENIRKSRVKWHELTCPVCKKKFKRTASQLRGRRSRMLSNTICCCRRCGGIYSHRKKDKKN